jgi:hypothetical protein
MEFGEMKWLENEISKTVANIVLTITTNLSKSDNFFINYFFPALNKKSFSSCVKVS